MRPLLILAVALAAAWPLRAAEKASPEVSKQRATSLPSEISVRPLFVYIRRARLDPFLPGDLQKKSPELSTKKVDVSDLILAGFTEIDGVTTALFKHRNNLRTFSLRLGRLYSPEGSVVNDIQGRISDDKTVQLKQGDRQLVFNNFATKK